MPAYLPDAELPVDRQPLGFAETFPVLVEEQRGRVIVRDSKSDVFHGSACFIHDDAVDAVASGRPDGTEDRQADDEEKTQAAVFFLRHENRSFMLGGGMTGMNFESRSGFIQ